MILESRPGPALAPGFDFDHGDSIGADGDVVEVEILFYSLGGYVVENTISVREQRLQVFRHLAFTEITEAVIAVPK